MTGSDQDRSRLGRPLPSDGARDLPSEGEAAECEQRPSRRRRRDAGATWHASRFCSPHSTRGVAARRAETAASAPTHGHRPGSDRARPSGSKRSRSAGDTDHDLQEDQPGTGPQPDAAKARRGEDRPGQHQPPPRTCHRQKTMHPGWQLVRIPAGPQRQRLCFIMVGQGGPVGPGRVTARDLGDAGEKHHPGKGATRASHPGHRRGRSVGRQGWAQSHVVRRSRRADRSRAGACPH